ncbi:MAG TPA: hypothetical protein VLM11_09430 [Streptosporangiaceae bacterium]|nr:hypothetical protein [Streptosporangiaceae bacterium]
MRGASGPDVFCAVLAWSRFRFMRVAADERTETMLAECFEVLGGVPGKVLAAMRSGLARASSTVSGLPGHPGADGS